MEPIKKWSHTKRGPNTHYYFFPIYVKGDSQLYAQLYKHDYSDIIVIHLRDAIAISGDFIESKKEEVDELLNEYYKQNKRTFNQAVMAIIFERYFK